MKRYIVIGASAAGISGAKTLREIDKDAEIILVSKDTQDRKSTRLNSSHSRKSRMPSSA